MCISVCCLQGTQTSRWRVKQSLRWLWRRHFWLQTAKQNVVIYFCSSRRDPGECQALQSPRWAFSRHRVHEWNSSPHCYCTVTVLLLSLPLCKRGHFAFVMSPKATSKPSTSVYKTSQTDLMKHLEKVKGHRDKTLAALSQTKYWSEV